MASGDSLDRIHPWSGTPPTSDAAERDTRNNREVLDFDAGTSESMDYGPLIMPENYDGGGLTFTVHYAMSTATSGTVRWDIQLENMSGLDLDTGSFANANNASENVPGSAGVESTVDVTFAHGGDMDNITAGDIYRLRATRNTADSASGDAELLGIHAKET